MQKTITVEALRKAGVPKWAVAKFAELFGASAPVNAETAGRLIANDLAFAMVPAMSQGARFVTCERTLRDQTQRETRAAFDAYKSAQEAAGAAYADAMRAAKARLDTAKTAAERSAADALASALVEALGD